MKRSVRFIFFLIAIVVSIPGNGQNLLQNPSFESLSRWDEFWLLSTTAPSSIGAVATEITTDSHEGLKSVELSNTDFLKWTYFYSDSVNAPLSFSANKRYEIRAWIKSIEEGKSVVVSVFWNDKLNEMILYNGNPDPLTNPDWFMIKDTITPIADFNDGYLSLGFRAGKNGFLGTGRLLLDDISVIRLPDTNTEILSFSFPEQTGPAIIDALLHTVTIEVPYGADAANLTPGIGLSDGATVVPASGVASDFSLPLVFTVTAEDGTTIQNWTIKVTKGPPSKNTDILSFVMAEQTGPATIDNVLHTIILELAFGTNLSSLVPIFGLSAGATINPASGLARNFSTPVIYKVTAEDGIKTQDYIIALMLSAISNETDIVSFSLLEQAGSALIDNLLHSISIEVPYGTDVTGLVPAIGVSAGASVDPLSGVAADFSVPFVYKVTAEDGIAIQDWTVSVVSFLNTETDIVTFTLPEQAGPALIDNLLHAISIELPYGTDVTGLVPTIGVSTGASVDPLSGVASDFTLPFVYTVTAEDGLTTMDWKITVVVLLNTETDIVSFTLAEQAGPALIDNLLHAISIEVPYGTDVTGLVPTIGVSTGASVDPVSGVATDFTLPFVYTVTAIDGLTTMDWTVSVVSLLNTETEIVSFTLPEQTGPALIDKNLHRVSIEVEKETDVTALVPTIVISEGAAIDPASVVATDFTSAVNYIVTGENGVNTQDWNVTVIVDPAVFAEVHHASIAIYVYPNPATDKVNIEIPASGDIYLHDVLGRVVAAVKDASVKTSIPVSDLERGIYFVHVRWKNTSRVSKIILE